LLFKCIDARDKYKNTQYGTGYQLILRVQRIIAKEKVLVLFINCFLDFEMWALHSKVNAVNCGEVGFKWTKCLEKSGIRHQREGSHFHWKNKLWHYHYILQCQKIQL